MSDLTGPGLPSPPEPRSLYEFGGFPGDYSEATYSRIVARIRQGSDYLEQMEQYWKAMDARRAGQLGIRRASTALPGSSVIVVMPYIAEPLVISDGNTESPKIQSDDKELRRAMIAHAVVMCNCGSPSAIEDTRGHRPAVHPVLSSIAHCVVACGQAMRKIWRFLVRR